MIELLNTFACEAVIGAFMKFIYCKRLYFHDFGGDKKSN